MLEPPDCNINIALVHPTESLNSYVICVCVCVGGCYGMFCVYNQIMWIADTGCLSTWGLQVTKSQCSHSFLSLLASKSYQF